MTAHDTKLIADDAVISDKIKRCISLLYDAKARERITTAWANGWLLGDHAIALLIDLDLVEPPMVAHDE